MKLKHPQKRGRNPGRRTLLNGCYVKVTDAPSDIRVVLCAKGTHGANNNPDTCSIANSIRLADKRYAEVFATCAFVQTSPIHALRYRVPQRARIIQALNDNGVTDSLTGYVVTLKRPSRCQRLPHLRSAQRKMRDAAANARSDKRKVKRSYELSAGQSLNGRIRAS